MSHYYVCCDLGLENARVTLGTLDRGTLTIGEISRFKNVPLQDKYSAQWDIASLFQQTLASLREVGKFDEPVDGISCTSWADDYLLFDSGGSLITPAYHRDSTRFPEGMEKVLSKVEKETIYRETGVIATPGKTLFQLGSEGWVRMRRANQLLPVADAFNYLLSGVSCIEISQASAMQLFNPVTREWSAKLTSALKLPRSLLPPVVAGGTKLGGILPEIAKQTGLHHTRVLASCSHDIAAAVMGLPVTQDDAWGYLSCGAYCTMGTQLLHPIISRESHDLNFTNELGHGGTVLFSRRMPGLGLVDECRHAWKERDRELDADVLMHLAACSEPFESLINPSDELFQTPGDLPSKIQEYCMRTGQPVPRKPGAVVRCILESMALQQRRTFEDMERLTGRRLSHMYLLGNTTNNLLNHFTANALQIPLIIAPAEATSIGNVMAQAIALGNVKSIDEMRAIVRSSFRTQTIHPHAAAWNSAYDRFAGLGCAQVGDHAFAA